ncbi:hypothetical protein [Calothrix sp. NIES-2098]|uniref:WD40 domain-containing protein n=1 Tax=Calothrix sp. NIES-2098 TaxID=1954171 RepID=UPI000B620413|nr:WD repeat-containing protein [Calothrix sp. NIES-2098]
MPRVTYGPTVKTRVKHFLEVLLHFSEEKQDGMECRWENCNPPCLIVRTKLRVLETLIRNDDRCKKLSKDDIREAIHYMKDFLKILEDHRVKQRGAEDWHFTLTLWSIDRVENLKQFELIWEQKRPEKSKQQEESMRTIEKVSKSLLPDESVIIASKASNINWGEAPSLSNFFGRTEEVETLKEWIVTERCRLVAIVGIGGIGKTGLSVRLGQGGVGKTDLSLKLAEGIQSNFNYLIWQRLINAPTIAEILLDFIKFFSNQEEITLPDTIDRQLSRLLHYLRTYRCLLILDNFESVLKRGDYGGEYRKGYEGYGQLLRQVGETPHQSCVLLTSREQPKEIALLEGKSEPVRLLQLKGLDEIEGRKIFTSIGLFSGSDEQWKKLIKLYNGNPLALKLAAKHIQEVFGGNISEFLEEGQPVFGRIQEVLMWQFERLSNLEKEVLYWLAINRESVSLRSLRDDILSPSAKKKVASTINSLLQRSLIERSENEFTLQPVLMEYITEQLVENICEEIISGKVELFNTHALLKALSKEYLREAQTRLILQSIQERLVNYFGSQQNVESHLKAIIIACKVEFRYQSGYLGGNILNLLCHMKSDLKGYDFSHLAVRQAYLQDVILYEVNFAYSQFDKCIFTQILGAIFSIVFSPSGKLLTVGDAKNEIRLYQVVDGQLILTFKGHSDWVRSIAFSPDGKTLASGSEDQTLKLWDISTGQCLNTLQASTHRIRSVAFSPDGQTLASGSDDYTVRLWNVVTGQCINILREHTNRIWSVAFSPDGQTLASGSEDNTVKIWNFNTGKCLNTLQGHTSWVRTVAFSPDGQFFASGSEDQTVRLWNLSTGQCINILRGHIKRITSIAFTPDGQTLVSSSFDQTVRLWNLSTGQCISTLQENRKGLWSGGLWSADFSADGQTLASGSEDRVMKIWDINSGKCINTLCGYSNWILSVDFSVDRQTLASGSEDKIIRIWNIYTGKCLKTLLGHKNRIWSVVFSLDGQIIASGSDDQTVKLWDVSTGECLKTLQGHTSWVRAVALSPDGKILASGSGDKTIKLWDVSTGECLKTLQGHGDRVWSVAFSPNSQTLVSGSGDKTIKLWDVSTGECLKTLQGHGDRVWSVAFSPNSQTLVSGSNDKTIKLWDVSTGKCLKTFQGHTKGVVAVGISTDEKIIISGSEDYTVKIWNNCSGKCLYTLQKHTNLVRSVAFNANSQILASSSYDETINLWNLQTGECLKTLKAPRPYEGMNITGVIGLTDSQKIMFKELGAIEIS